MTCEEREALLADAYRRGVEAMRQAAVRACENESAKYLRLDAWAWHYGTVSCATAIRDLPAPEGK